MTPSRPPPEDALTLDEVRAHPDYCVGCDSVCRDVKDYRASFDGAPLEHVRYCDGCAEHAQHSGDGCDSIERTPVG